METRDCRVATLLAMTKYVDTRVRSVGELVFAMTENTHPYNISPTEGE